jgi:hypothetical protein
VRRNKRSAGFTGSIATVGQQVRVRSRFGPIMVTVTPDAIAGLQQDGLLSPAGYVISDNRELIEAIALRKFEAAEFDGNGWVVIDETDIAR